MKINEIIKAVHENAVDKGFWKNKREVGTLLMLCVSELSEAMEADRKNRFASIEKFCNSLHVKNATFQKSFESNIKDTFEDELADTVIRIFDICGGMNINLEEHIKLKIEYNQSREKMHGKKY